MKRVLFWTAIGLLASATTLPAQRGGGVCDSTARRVRQGGGPGNNGRGANCPRMKQGGQAQQRQRQQQRQQQQQQPPAKK